jgi:hypothetical protein
MLFHFYFFIFFLQILCRGYRRNARRRLKFAESYGPCSRQNCEPGYFVVRLLPGLPSVTVIALGEDLLCREQRSANLGTDFFCLFRAFSAYFIAYIRHTYISSIVKYQIHKVHTYPSCHRGPHIYKFNYISACRRPQPQHKSIQTTTTNKRQRPTHCHYGHDDGEGFLGPGGCSGLLEPAD